MPLRPFHPEDRPADRVEHRGAHVRIVGGSVEARRAHGHGSALRGVHVLNPVFCSEDEDALRAWCDPADPRPLVVEIGFQRARFARALCSARPELRYLGFEIRRKFCEDADAWLQRGGCDNYRLALVDARELLPEVIAPASLDALYAFFPDPWWKRKHRKRRLLDRSFVALAAHLLKPDGVLLLKTDVPGYADWAEAEMRAVSGVAVTRLDAPDAGLPPTQRERRVVRAGMAYSAIAARRLAGVPIAISSIANVHEVLPSGGAADGGEDGVRDDDMDGVDWLDGDGNGEAAAGSGPAVGAASSTA